MTDDLFIGLSDLEELGREQDAIDIGENPLAGEWQRLLEISTRIAGELQIDTVLRSVMDAAIEITGAERGFLILLNSAGEPVVRIAHNLNHSEVQDIQGSISRTVIEKILFTRKPMLINDVESNELLSAQVSVRNLQLKSVMGAPIICRNQLLGMAYVDSASLAGIFSHKEFAIFVTFVNLAGVAIDNATLFESMLASSEKYRALKEYNENILRTIPTGLLVLDRERRLEYYNPGAQNIFPALKRGDLLQGIFKQREVLEKSLSEIREGMQPQKLQLEINGRYYEMDFFSVLTREGKVGLLISDVTDRIQLEKQIFQEEKRTLTMQLAGGIAHEISNHLFPIQGRAQLTLLHLEQSKLKLDPDVPRSLKIIEEQVQKIERIADNLRHLAKPPEAMIQSVDLIEILRHSVEVLQNTAGKIKRFSLTDDSAALRLKVNYSDQPLIISGDADQLQQVFMNLIINAAHALEDVGKGTLSVGAELRDGKALAYVEDTGTGIPEGIRERIFEPYFTTKPEDKGTGLGLAIVKGILDSHGAELRLTTEINTGTRFELLFPLYNA